MSINRYLANKLEFPVSDIIIGDTIIKQKARFVSLHHPQAEDGTCTVTLELLVTMYASDSRNADGYGVELHGEGFWPRPVFLKTDNQTLVNPNTGEIVLIEYRCTPEEWQAAIDGEVAVMYQSEFFAMLRDYSSIDVGDLIRNNILNAITLGNYIPPFLR